MKLLTVLINNRIDHVIDFEPRKKSPDSYIVENTGGKLNLFMFYRETETSSLTELIYQTQNGKRRATLTGLCAEGLDSKPSDNNTYQVTINLYLKVEDEPDSSRRGSKSVNDSSVKDWCTDFNTRLWEARNLKVNLPVNQDAIYNVKVNFIAMEEDGYINQNSFLINVVPAKYIYDVVLDYGSEASQMLIFNRGTHDQVTINNIVPLFPMFKTSIGDNAVESSDYLQFDADDGDNFFKSFFFALRKPDSDNPDPCLSIKENMNLMLMTPVNKLDHIRQSYLTIPNIKVASHGGVRLPKLLDSHGVQRDIFSFGDNYFYRTLVNAFLYQAMRYSNNGGKPSYLNICLLMPNVYTQPRVTENLVNVADDVMTLAERNQEVGFVSGVEVSALSESDASFLGFMGSLPVEPRSKMKRGRYLILDAGKGTMDFSVLDYRPDADNRHMYNSIFRSGIIGAGNAITYSVLLAILNDVIDKQWPSLQEDKRRSEISDFIKEKITSKDADEAEICAMLNSLEQYKRLYNNEELSRSSEFPVELGNINRLTELKLEALNNILVNFNTKKYRIKDDSYILNMIDELAFSVANKLKDSYSRTSSARIDFVVFAGRGFQMIKLKEAVLKNLKKVNSDICADMTAVQFGISNSTSATYKNICLFVQGPLTSGRYNGRLVGRPQLIYHDENSEIPQSLIDESSTTVNPDAKPKSSDSFLKTIKTAYKLVLDILIPKPTDTINYLFSEDVDELNRELVNGFSVNFTSSADEVVFSGVSYQIPANINAQYPAQIFFTGSEFVFRQDGEVGYLSAPINLNSQHIFESSFPFAELSEAGAAMVPFPKSSSVANNYGVPGEEYDDDDDIYGSEDEDILNRYRG